MSATLHRRRYTKSTLHWMLIKKTRSSPNYARAVVKTDRDLHDLSRHVARIERLNRVVTRVQNLQNDESVHKVVNKSRSVPFTIDLAPVARGFVAATVVVVVAKETRDRRRSCRAGRKTQSRVPRQRDGRSFGACLLIKPGTRDSGTGRRRDNGGCSGARERKRERKHRPS